MYNNYTDNYSNPYVGYNTLPFANNYYQNKDSYHQTDHDSSIKKISALKLNNLIRQLWEEHITWTRLAIISIANSTPDTQLISTRLLRNATDFGNLFANFYRLEIAQKFSKLIHDHLSIAADLVMAAKKQDNNAITIIEKKWYKNADDIANFLNQINPNWDKNEIQKMMYQHLALTKAEAVAILTNKYAEGITIFDEIEKQALMMADTYIEGLIKQLSGKITN